MKPEAEESLSLLTESLNNVSLLFITIIAGFEIFTGSTKYVLSFQTQGEIVDEVDLEHSDSNEKK